MACLSLIYSDYLVGILRPVLLWFTLIIPLVSYGLSFFYLLWLSLLYLKACPSLIYSFWLSLWYLMACPSFIYSDYLFGILWPVLLWFTAFVYFFCFFWPVLVWFTYYPFGISCPFLLLFTLIIPVVSYGLFFFVLQIKQDQAIMYQRDDQSKAKKDGP
jgi:hypothetical protein